MKNTKLLLSSLLACAALTSANAEIVADIGGDYIDASTLPAGWSYLYSNAATGGTEVELTANTLVGNAGNLGFEGDSTQNTPAILGAITAVDGELEVFTDGFEGHAAVVGTDLVLHPGNTAPTSFVIARYTFSAADMLYGTTADISGAFRDLGGGTTGVAELSIIASVYHNSTVLFSATGSAGRLFQADGTFNIGDVTVAEGDSISFVVDRNGHYAGDETALSGKVSIPEPSSYALLLGSLGMVMVFARRRRA
ncbi:MULTISPECIES: PEP-CTERM sorting domain-containing protein [unclassified Lentimonas]|uniref:PEP-CTERM sorting domain-containing protein n=1 Tax=unclassified Lentimonas TaxID=2630993 RepID=UPI001324D1B6|nr:MULTISPECIES: PEP-CTERM sorting domain-containing protein [unclassified Lentimonas]CAA6677668.1 Unannotated [Lentimonas sp. CC4]CAA6684932.1 Unannotated [Lentimonas sp. CC6]CAA7077956.1 Unannotated [Lentimonas sp. CC4]CAA7169877.1 Unannotated [Lentimonas sp. CC21]CAA7181467.1 Unannotated [Lentimonas sp. CC8]